MLWFGIVNADHFWKTKKIFLTISFLILSFPIYAFNFTSTTPADNAIDVDPSTDLVLTHTRRLTAISSKYIKLYKSSGDVLIESIEATSASVTLSDANKIATVDFSSDMDSATDYYVLIDAGAFTRTGSDNTYDGISSADDLNFTTGSDTTAPTITSTTVASDNSSISVTFSEAVYDTNGGSGDLEVGDFSLSISGGNATVSSTPSSISASGNVYTLGLSLSGTANGSETLTVVPSSSTAIYDAAGNAASTSQSNNTVSLNAASDTTAPTVTFSPADGATDVATNSNITLTFSEAIRLVSDGNINNGNVDGLVTLKDTNASGSDLGFNATINNDKTIITISPDSNFTSEQVIYVAIKNNVVEDSSDNAVGLNFVTFTASTLPTTSSTYPQVAQKNIGIDANITLTFDRAMYVDSSGSGRKVTIYNADTGLAVFDEQSNSSYITGAGTTKITINPPSDLEEYVNYYILIGSSAFRDSNNTYFAGISDTSELTFRTAKDPNKYIDVVALNESGVNHSMNQVEKTISSVNNRQNFIRRNGGRNASHQGIKIKFNNSQLDDITNKLTPLINHFNKYNLSNKLANATDRTLPDGWGLWTSGEISIGDTNKDNGSDRHSKSREISIGLDKVIDSKRLAGISYRIDKTNTNIGNTGTKSDSNTQSWSLYGSIKNGGKAELEGLVGRGDISTDHTRVDGIHTYTGTRNSQQVFACMIARENYQIQTLDLSPFIRIDSSYTKQDAYTETGTGEDALHYKSNNFHNSIISIGIDANTKLKLGDKSIRPYTSFRHKKNTEYESNNVMYYTSNPIKEYTQNITANSDESGFNLVLGLDIQSPSGWIINTSYEVSESEEIFLRGLRFRVDWKF